MLLAVLYIGVAKLSLTLDAVGGFATLVWPPTGIALAALLVLGPRLWPGIATGALVVNAWSGAPLHVASGIALGNTAEAVLGAWWLRRIGFHTSLDRLKDVIALVAVALLSTIVSATIGVVSLKLGGVIGTDRFGVTWFAWWVGDAIGALVAVPLLLTWSSASPWKRARIPECVGLAAATIGVSVFIFGPWNLIESSALRQVHMLFPVLIWAAVRFEQRGVAVTTLAASALAIAGTAGGYGPFVHGELHERLLHLQAFMAVVAATALVLGAVIAERRTAQEELRRSHALVNEAVRARDEFLSIASHELRTPLSALMLQVDGLRQPFDASNPEDGERRLATKVDRVARASQRLAMLVDALLDVSRAANGHLVLERSRCDLAEVVRDVVERMRFDAARARCTLQLRAQVPVVGNWDRFRLEQCVTNLVSNAIKYGAGKPIEIEVEAMFERGLIRVRDFGIGIPAEDLDRIFARFARAVPARQYGGLGLGLYITRQIIEAHGGTIRAISEPGHGAEFIVELPASIALS